MTIPEAKQKANALWLKPGVLMTTVYWNSDANGNARAHVGYYAIVRDEDDPQKWKTRKLILGSGRDMEEAFAIAAVRGESWVG